MAPHNDSSIHPDLSLLPARRRRSPTASTPRGLEVSFAGLLRASLATGFYLPAYAVFISLFFARALLIPTGDIRANAPTPRYSSHDSPHGRPNGSNEHPPPCLPFDPPHHSNPKISSNHKSLSAIPLTNNLLSARILNRFVGILVVGLGETG